MDQQPVTPQEPAQQTPLPLVPETWPGAWGAYKYSKEAIKRNWVVLLVLILISGIVSSILEKSLGQSGQLLSSLFSIYISVVTMVAYFITVRGGAISWGDVLTKTAPVVYLKYFVNIIALGLSLAVAFLLLIVPGIILLPRLIFAPYLLVDKKLGPLEAMSKSWEISKGHSGKVWGVIGANIAIALLCVTIIGIPFSLYFLFMYSATFYVLYEFITTKTSVDIAAPVTNK